MLLQSVGQFQMLMALASSGFDTALTRFWDWNNKGVSVGLPKAFLHFTKLLFSGNGRISDRNTSRVMISGDRGCLMVLGGHRYGKL